MKKNCSSEEEQNVYYFLKKRKSKIRANEEEINWYSRMEGRLIDNANFLHCEDIEKVSDEQLYENLLDEFPSWLQEARGKGILK